MLFQGLKVRGLFYVPLALLFGVAISASIAYAGLQTGPHEVSIQGAQQVDHPCDRLLQLSSSASCFRPLKGSGRAVPEGGDTNRLEWVAAVSSNDIWAVGYYYDQQVGVYRTLAEHWDGAVWRVVPAPNPGTSSNQLVGVTAIASNDVWAVGGYADDIGSYPLVEHWNGSTWSVVATPSAPTPSATLNTVSASSSHDVWAVGYYLTGSVVYTLAGHWNGSAWQWTTGPNPGAYTNNFYSVAAISADDVWAVGLYRDSDLSIAYALIAHWDGHSWSAIPNPDPGSGSFGLGDVLALSANNVWAFGTWNGGYATLAEHWDGSRWTLVPTPSVGTGNNYFYGADATLANDIWAVGRYNDPDAGTDRTLIEHWNGSQWSIVQSPNVGTDNNKVIGVAALSGQDAWAVGYYYNDNQYSKTLVERWDGTGWTIVSSPSPGEEDPTPTATPTPRCPGERFSDVCPSDYFYIAVTYLSNHSVISGYADGTFRPYNNTTRGQLCKIVVLAQGWAIDTTGGPHFRDVPSSDSFYASIETAYNHGIISGYSCGSGCLDFRPGADVTRSQLCKIVVTARGWPIDSSGGPHFTDVPASNPFYGYIETAYNHAIISGYSNRTFLPGNSATRGQICRIVYNAVTSP